MESNLITPEVNKTYKLHHNGKNIIALFLGERKLEGFDSYTRMFGTKRHHRGYTHYLFLNQRTQREIIIKSRVKIKGEI